MAAKPCSITGCGNPHTARGWCQKHYDRWRTNGSPYLSSPSPTEAFWDNVDRSGPVVHPGWGECWIWNGRTDSRDNGFFRGTTALRWSYLNFVGPLPQWDEVWTCCGKKRCVRPDHLVAIRRKQYKTHCPYGHEYRQGPNRRWCPTCAHNRNHSNRIKRRAAHQNRRAVYATGDRDISVKALFELADGICQLCFEPVDPSLSHRHPLMQTIDHIVPISRGGLHTWGNVRLAHYRCNQRRRY